MISKLSILGLAILASAVSNLDIRLVIFVFVSLLVLFSISLFFLVKINKLSKKIEHGETF